MTTAVFGLSPLEPNGRCLGLPSRHGMARKPITPLEVPLTTATTASTVSRTFVTEQVRTELVPCTCGADDHSSRRVLEVYSTHAEHGFVEHDNVIAWDGSSELIDQDERLLSEDLGCPTCSDNEVEHDAETEEVDPDSFKLFRE